MLSILLDDAALLDLIGAALAADRDSAWEAMRVMNEAADDLGMTFGAEKSGVMSFDEGFGACHSRKRPPGCPGVQ